MPPTSRPVSYAAKLHRIHAGATATRVEFQAPVHLTWRGEGRDNAIKEAMAYRLAACWNVLEGIPSAALEAGMLRTLCDLVMASDLAGAQALVQRWGDSIDMTNGRPHDCPACLPAGDEAPPDASEGDGEDDGTMEMSTDSE